ncbi:MAG: PAS domain-containing protein, partial [Myxococcota bacterium]
MSVVEYLNGINRVLAKLGHLSDESQVLESTVTMLVDQPANVCAAIYLLDPATTQWTRRAQAGPDCPVICPVPPKQVVAPVRLRSGPASDGMVQAFAFPIHLEAIITGAMLIGTAVEHDETMVAVNAMLASVIGSLVSVVAEQEQLYAALDEAPALISIHRAPDHRLVFTNRRYREMVPEAQLGHAPHDFLEPETAAQQLALQKQVLATGTPFLGEAIPIDVSTLAGFSEDVAYFDYTLQPLRHGRADPGLFVHATDVTGSVQALEEAQRAQERYQQLVDDVDAIVWEVDVETFDFTFVSRAAETMTGYPLAGWTAPGFWV